MNGYRLTAVSKRRRQVYRGKFIFVLAAVIAVISFSVIQHSRIVTAHESVAEAPVKYYKSIEIQSGDTLWNIADTYADQQFVSITEYIEELRILNGLVSDEIHEGKYLTVIYYDSSADCEIS